MRVKLFALEDQLNVDAVIEQQDQYKQSSEYDALYGKLQQADADIADDTDVVDDTDINIADEGFVDVVSKSIDVVRSAATIFANIGLHYGIPALSKVYRGVLAVLGKSVSLLFNGIITLDEYAERKYNSFTSIRADVASLQRSLELVDGTTESLCSKERTINTLKISDSVDVLANLHVLHKYLDTTVVALSQAVLADIQHIKHIMGYVIADIHKTPTALMAIPLNIPGMVKAQIPGYIPTSDTVISNVYKHVLPGDVISIIDLPANVPVTLEDISIAYSNSKLYLGISTDTSKLITTMPYLSKAQLTTVLNELDKICVLGLAHVEMYRNIANRKRNLRYNFRIYISSLVSSSKRTSLDNSLANYVYLKCGFIDRVYLAGAMDIHDYTVKVATTALSYVKDNIKQLETIK